LADLVLVDEAAGRVVREESSWVIGELGEEPAAGQGDVDGARRKAHCDARDLVARPSREDAQQCSVDRLPGESEERLPWCPADAAQVGSALVAALALDPDPAAESARGGDAEEIGGADRAFEDGGDARVFDARVVRKRIGDELGLVPEAGERLLDLLRCGVAYDELAHDPVGGARDDYGRDERDRDESTCRRRRCLTTAVWRRARA